MKVSIRLRVSRDVASRQVGDELVLMDLASGTYFGLNLVGGRIWELIEEQPRALSEVRDQIVEQFEIPSEVAEQDLIALVEQLLERGLLAHDREGE